mgnify:CR=1 FL=1|tara:strand:+ start:893 stop:1975 length:1083 start_codon:yes stop_codon:yes gene_type:complete
MPNQKPRIGEDPMNFFKPMKSPNFETGSVPIWGNLITNPKEWACSEKYDGVRVQLLHTGRTLSREMNAFPSRHVRDMGKQVCKFLPVDTILEAELYSPEMTFTEILHFAKTEDVTSNKTRKKYEALWRKTQGKWEIKDGKLVGWKFPGRSVDWLCRWHESLKFYIFDLWSKQNSSAEKQERYLSYEELIPPNHPLAVIIENHTFDTLEEIYNYYESILEEDGEGIMLVKWRAPYKFGRHSVKSNWMYKMKDDKKIFEGVILGVFESTVAKEGTTKTISNLGRSKTSQLKEDREPSGMAGGFRVRMRNGRELKVSLNRYNHEQRRKLLKEEDTVKGIRINFTGMKPVKEGGVPRHAHYTKI